jgi:Sulfotransferase domain/N-terminal domain of galactosyltransferase
VRVAFCSTCKGRAQHIKLTLPQNLADNARFADCVFVLLDYGSPDDLAAYVRQHHGAALDSGRLAFYSLLDAGPFQMAHAKNVAHRIGVHLGADILVNLDADNFTGPDLASWIDAQFRARPDIFLWGRMIHRCHLDAGEARCAREREHAGECSVVPHHDPEQRPRLPGLSGRIACTSAAFLKAGGYDERYASWGPDDKDFNIRLQRLGYAPQEFRAQNLRSIQHSDKLRFRYYPQARDTAQPYDSAPAMDPYTAVVNFGRFGLGTVRSHADELLTLAPVPTRIFGIGMQKTATHSLDTAFGLLGFDSAHWITPRWARAVWVEMWTHGKSLTLERHYALSDFPIAVLFRNLDKAYPGSKFILTVRDEIDWLRSVRNHWRASHNPHRETWDNDAFTHRMHEKVYGQREFDAAVFLERYRRHNAEVRAYFRDRPDDLLVLDMETDPGWAPLCRFLNCAVPGAPYPRSNQTGSTP